MPKIVIDIAYTQRRYLRNDLGKTLLIVKDCLKKVSLKLFKRVVEDSVSKLYKIALNSCLRLSKIVV